MNSSNNAVNADSRIDPTVLEAWKHHEDIAVHFNDLIMRVRTRALAVLAAIIAAGGIALKIAYEGTNTIPYGTIALLLIVLLAFWIAIWMLDYLYYNRLLIGAVDGILELENRINGEGPIEINMSHMIESSVRDNVTIHISKKLLIGPLLFYLVVSGVLLVGVVLSAAMFFCGQAA